MAFAFNRRTGSQISGEDVSYTPEQLLEAVNAYAASFGNPVPLDLLTAAACAFRSTELMTTLLGRIDKNDPVVNWIEFKARFLSHEVTD